VPRGREKAAPLSVLAKFHFHPRHSLAVTVVSSVLSGTLSFPISGRSTN
jgi:hypothetical protein